MKNVLIALTFILCSTQLKAQTCVPDTTIDTAGIYPEYVDTAWVGNSFEHVFQILAVRDTTVTIANNTVEVTVDSIIIEEIIGLPGDFVYQCNPAGCVYTYEDVGCASLTGNPVDSNVGNHPLEIVITSYAKWGSIALDQTDTLRDFTLVVWDSARLGVEDFDASIKLYPNPNRGNEMEIRSHRVMTNIEITDAEGRVVLQIPLKNSLRERLDISSLAKGLHLVHISTPAGVIHKKLMLLH